MASPREGVQLPAGRRGAERDWEKIAGSWGQYYPQLLATNPPQGGEVQTGRVPALRGWTMRSCSPTHHNTN